MAFNPVIPALGAAIAVMTTLMFFIESKKLEKQRPSTDLSKLSIFSKKEKASFMLDNQTADAFEVEPVKTYL